MIFSDLQDRVEERLDEDGTSPVYYTTTQIKDALNRAQRLFAFLSLCIEKRDQTFSLSAGTTYYDVSATFSDFLLPLRIKAGTSRILPVRQEQLDLRYGAWESTAGTPTHYFMRGFYFFGCYPRPAGAGTSLLFSYAAEPATLTNAGDTPEIPEEYHMSLIDYAVYRLRWQEGGQELAKVIPLFGRFLDEVEKCAIYTRARAMAQRYDSIPFDLATFDKGQLLKAPMLKPIHFGQLKPQNNGNHASAPTM